MDNESCLICNGHANYCTECYEQSIKAAAGDYVEHVKRIKELEAELLVVNMLLNTRVELLHTIPECPEHGKDCVPHAIDWVLKRKEG